jgi:hypothetical protein
MPTAMQRPWASEAPSNREIESRPHLTCLRLSAPSLFLSLSAANAGSITSFQFFHQGSQMPHRFQDLRGRLLRVSSVLGVFAFNGLHLKGAIQGPLLRQADRCLAAFRDCRARPFPSKDRSESGTRSLGHVPRPSAFFGNTEMQTPVRLLDARSFQTPAGRLRCLVPIRISVEVLTSRQPIRNRRRVAARLEGLQFNHGFQRTGLSNPVNRSAGPQSWLVKGPRQTAPTLQKLAFKPG